MTKLVCHLLTNNLFGLRLGIGKKTKEEGKEKFNMTNEQETISTSA